MFLQLSVTSLLFRYNQCSNSSLILALKKKIKLKQYKFK